MRLLAIFIFIGHFSFGQRDYFVIKGQVTDDEQPSKRIYGIRTKISFNDSLFLETDCDSLGRYSFSVSRNFPRTFKTVVTVYQDNEVLKKQFPPPTDCPYVIGPDQYFASKDLRIINYKEKLTDFVADFSLKKVLICYRLPTIGFEKNSLTLLPCHGDNPDTAIFCLKHTLLSNPTIIIELVGHSWNEKSLKNISLSRALMVRQRLISYGIDSLRLVVSSKGDTEPIHNKKTIKKAKTKSEKLELETENRSVFFKVVAFDYDPKLKKRVKNTADDDK
jgi:outer membrane protein OmpA-like peptidoglycan-associated protein